ncbi:hypothetical protein AL710_11995 [Clostridium botulinum]|uniref:hypothetical protein n=1 Tax=Clostridium botulinum TaxID=1491 RepID=UPI00099DD84F|nr:hypothetical protein [Clostridium botulinum]OPD20409.1 hypothetical protein AL710_11995 [Clostridium botulinum]
MERPILFNTEMVMAILKNKKTQTRRIIKPQPKQPIPLGVVVSSTESKNEGCFGWGQDKCGGIIDYARPPYKVGDILYVRETWANTWTPDGDEGFVYRADGKPSTFPYWGNARQCKHEVWIPSIHMPKKAARIFLKVTNVRVERLQDITEEGAKSEGAAKQIWYQPYGTRSENNQEYVGDITQHVPNYITGFAGIWDGTLGKWDDWLYSFKRNPWIWVIEFEKM